MTEKRHPKHDFWVIVNVKGEFWTGEIWVENVRGARMYACSRYTFGDVERTSRAVRQKTGEYCVVVFASVGKGDYQGPWPFPSAGPREPTPEDRMELREAFDAAFLLMENADVEARRP